MWSITVTDVPVMQFKGCLKSQTVICTKKVDVSEMM